MYRIQLKSNQRYRHPLSCDVGKMSGNLIIDRLGWLCLIQVSFQVSESTVATQDLNSLLFYSGGSDAKVLQTRKSWVLHVCCVKLENKKIIICSVQRPHSWWYNSPKPKVIPKSWFSYPFDFVWGCPGLKWAHCEKLSSEAEKKKNRCYHMMVQCFYLFQPSHLFCFKHALGVGAVQSVSCIKDDWKENNV